MQAMGQQGLSREHWHCSQIDAADGKKGATNGVSLNRLTTAVPLPNA